MLITAVTAASTVRAAPTATAAGTATAASATAAGVSLPTAAGSGAGAGGFAASSGSRAAAATASCPLGLQVSAHLDPAGGAPSTVCSGLVPSFDGTPLSTDVTIPDGPARPRPLMVFLNGWGDHKTNFEASQLAGNANPYTWHWNNAWFASHGFAVLNFTARGFWHSCGKVPVPGAPSAGGITASDPVYLTEPGCQGRASWTHLADRRWEIRDVQTLVGKLVDAHVATPDQVVVTGDSYGGGQSWLLALSQDQVLHRNGTTTAWTSPDGTPIHLAAAVPLFGWTDLLQALDDNGGGSIAQTPAADSPPATSHTSPYGVEKLSYVSGLFALGEATAQYAPPGADPTADLPAWYAAIGAGEPYSADPIVAQAVTQLTRYRSALYLPVPPMAKAVPILTVQGVTDPLFPAIQSLQMEQRLRAAHPGYPVWTVLGDVGHSYADNPPAVWHHILTQANRWVLDVLHHRTPSQPKIEAATVACQAGQHTTWLTGNRLRTMASQVLVLSATTTASTTSAGTNPVVDLQTDPIATSGCRTLASSQAGGPGAASFTFAPADGVVVTGPGSSGTAPSTGAGKGAASTGAATLGAASTGAGALAGGSTTPAGSGALTLLGAPVVHANAVLTGTNAELAASLRDVNPATGQQTLITRCVERLTGRSGQTLHLAFELWPTAWTLLPGHQLQLQLTQSDAPTWRPDNEPSALQISGLQLRIPIAARP